MVLLSEINGDKKILWILGFAFTPLFSFTYSEPTRFGAGSFRPTAMLECISGRLALRQASALWTLRRGTHCSLCKAAYSTARDRFHSRRHVSWFLSHSSFSGHSEKHQAASSKKALPRS